MTYDEYEDIIVKVDREEFKKRALPLFDQIYRLAFGLTKDEDEAMDLVQDTYLKAWSAFEQFAPGTNIKAWLAKIAYNTFVNEYKRRSRVELQNGNQFVDHHRNPQEEIIENALDEDVERALKSLPEEYIAVIVMVDVVEMSYDEVAQVLDCPVGTIRSRVSRGRTLLKNKLYGYAKSRGLIK